MVRAQTVQEVLPGDILSTQYIGVGLTNTFPSDYIYKIYLCAYKEVIPLLNVDEKITVICRDVMFRADRLLGPFRYVVIYNDKYKILWYYDYGSHFSLYPGETFTVSGINMTVNNVCDRKDVVNLKKEIASSKWLGVRS